MGDSIQDIEGGKAASMRTCAVTYGYSQKEILESLSPDYIIDNLLELLNMTWGTNSRFYY